MVELSYRMVAYVLALLGPAALLTIRYALREITKLGKETVVIITGASSGIGKACAKEFYRLGCQVVLMSNNLERLDIVKKELLVMKECGNRSVPLIIPLNLANEKSIANAANEIGEKFPNGIHVLINNAGISYRGEIVSTSMDVYRNIMETNFFGHVMLTKALLPSMFQVAGKEEKAKAHIISVNSIQGRISLPHRSAYSVTKFASEAFFDCLRFELADSGIRVCNVYPSYVKTNLSLNAVTADGSKYDKMDKTTQNGMEPGFVASKIADAVRLNKEEVVLSDAKSSAAIWSRFLFPLLYFWVMKRRAKRKLD